MLKRRDALLTVGVALVSLFVLIALALVGLAMFVWRSIQYGPDLVPPNACIPAEPEDVARAASALAGREGENIELLGHIGGGHTEAVFVRGSSLIVKTGHELTVLDLAANPESPRRRAYKLTPGSLMGVDAAGETAYLSLYGIHRQDLTDLTADAELAYVPGTGLEKSVIVDTTAYLQGKWCESSGGDLLGFTECGYSLHTVDLSQPGATRCQRLSEAEAQRRIERQRARADDPGRASYANYAYVIDNREESLRIEDVSEPEAPRPVGAYAPPADHWGMAVMDSYVFWTGEGIDLWVIDVSDPGMPEGLPASLNQSRPPVLLEPLGPGFLAASLGGDQADVITLDVSDPFAPRVVGSWPPMSTGQRGPEDRALAVQWDASGRMRDIEHEANLLFVLKTAGLFSMDVTDPASPVPLGFLPKPVNEKVLTNDIRVVGDRVYVTYHDGNVERKEHIFAVLDLSDPAAPRELGRLVLPESLHAVEGNERFAFVSDGADGVHIIDTSIPSQPWIAATYAGAEGVYDMAYDGRFLYLAGSGSGLQVLDMSESTRPRLVASFPYAGSLEVEPPLIFLGGDTGLYILRFELAQASLP